MPTTTNYVWDEENLLAEADGSDTIQTVYTNEPQQYGNVVSSRISGTTSYHHFDAIGSTRQLTNSAGTVTDTMIYDAWGNVVNRNGTTATARLWVGSLTYYTDPETGFVWVLVRPYGPMIGRWTAVDPMDSLLRFSVGPYAYVLNAPFQLIDPSGLKPSVVYTAGRGFFRFATIDSDYKPPGTTSPVPDDIGSIVDLQWNANAVEFHFGDPFETPNPRCCRCKTIGFVQIVTTTRVYLLYAVSIFPSKEDKPWHVDRGVPYPLGTTGDVCPQPPGAPVRTTMHDEPGPPEGYNDLLVTHQQEGEACVVCLSGREANLKAVSKPERIR